MTVLEQAGKAMYDAGAYCGVCDYSDPECPECKQVCRTYARAALPIFREHFAKALEAEARNPRWAEVRRLHVLDAAASLRTTEG